MVTIKDIEMAYKASHRLSVYHLSNKKDIEIIREVLSKLLTGDEGLVFFCRSDGLKTLYPPGDIK